ncbi:aminotransferase class I/II-fold pyridoxal phosphate-dependent enzyme [Aneurinibacillus tyrosinisolvens]|uniref:aminotransferase class I/II-fold pyridoxal phosphate-dependent enzyme n=1 Tax=Aneurinibacillus tyrosinisolvens TaxID=1443435 RepID=UPI000A74A66A|nr:aminotransferase class I/II-fold pyridoxal phosphate-dependent enzyme [Aneurinibacillus tyrosinisolvens]
MNQNQAPLYEALLTYEKKKNTSFHVPGHKDGRVFDREGNSYFKPLLAIDGTEVEGLDDLHHPLGAIAEAQQLAAEVFGAEQTFFLVGGSTAGNLAAALTVCSPGDTIIVQRNAHKSLINGLLLAGARPVFISPNIDEETGAAAGISRTHIYEALRRFPTAKSVWITNPNYYGMGEDIRAIAAECHRVGIPLIVDEAHGAHFGQIDIVPASALSSGADLVIQSTHKMLTAMTMASMLHVQGNIVDRRRLASALSMVQSSSPSYPLMASLDLARRHLATEGKVLLRQTVERLKKIKKEIRSKLCTLSIYEKNSSVYSQDPLKWVVTIKHPAVTGYQLLDWFGELGCVAEMADTRNMVLAFSTNTSEEELNHLSKALYTLDQKLQHSTLPADLSQPSYTPMFSQPGTLFQPNISLQEAFYRPKKTIAVAESVGEYSGEMVIPYPPGIPLLIPGERITPEHLLAIEAIKLAGGFFQGASDERVNDIQVLAEIE